jgi:Fuc2NAc and GlcNAc transferase
VPVTAAISAFIAALLVTPFIRANARRWGLLDRPTVRSSHREVTPRGGGAAMVIGAGLSLALSPALWVHTPAALALLGGILALAAVGLCDDRWGLSPLIRLGIHLAVAAGFVAGAGSLDRAPLPAPLDLPLGPLGPVVSVLWIVAVINFYNFMDGIDGLAGVQAVVTGTGIAVAGFDPFSSFFGAALAGGAAGFLIYNWSPATIFLGDVGSGVLGYAFAALPFLAGRESRAALVTFVALSLWFFLADATWTLLRRVARGERVYKAHREHVYQRLVISGWTHAGVTTALGAAALGLTALALTALRLDETGIWWAVFLLATALFGLEMRLARLRGGRPGSIGDKGEVIS